MLRRAVRHGIRHRGKLGVLFGIFLAGCAGATFDYKYYNPQPVSYDGKLLGDKPEHDLDLHVCAPDATSQGKCVIMLAPEFFRLKQDYMDCQNQLIACQKPSGG